MKESTKLLVINYAARCPYCDELDGFAYDLMFDQRGSGMELPCDACGEVFTIAKNPEIEFMET